MKSLIAFSGGYSFGYTQSQLLISDVYLEPTSLFGCLHRCLSVFFFKFDAYLLFKWPVNSRGHRQFVFPLLYTADCISIIVKDGRFLSRIVTIT